MTLEPKVSVFTPGWGKKRNQALDERVKRLAGATDKGDAKPGASSPPVSRTRARAHRQPVFSPGAIVLDSGGRVEVVVKNLSATGAQVQAPNSARLVGATVDLVAPTLGRRRRVLVVWQKAGFLGVQFLD